MISEARLRDGSLALIWELLPKDRVALREGYEQLSEETRFHRFLTGVPHLTGPLLDHLVGEVDGVDHVALALVAIDAEGVGEGVGVARMIRYPDRPDGCWLSANARPLRNAGGRIAGAVSVVRDINDLRLQEQRAATQTRQLQEQASLLDLAHDAILARNDAQARAFGFRGTPAMIVGKFRVPGALTMAQFELAIADARKAAAKK